MRSVVIHGGRATLVVLWALVAASDGLGSPTQMGPGVVVPWDQVKEEEVLADSKGQWATQAVASTQYRPDEYSARQATGQPDVPTYSDSKRAWTPSSAERQEEWLDLTFANPVYATEVRVRQTLNPGSIVKIAAADSSGTWHRLWEGEDPNRYAKDRIAWFIVRFPPTAFPVQRIKIHLYTPAVKGWKQIDAVQLVGTAEPGASLPGTPLSQPSDTSTAQVPASPAPEQRAESASGSLPPGWEPRKPYDEEKTFVAPQATVKVAESVRRLASPFKDKTTFKGRITSPRIEIDNPYLDPLDPFFNVPRQMACLDDGSLLVFSTAKTHQDGRMKGNPYATGLWRIAPDGAITPVDRARHILSEGKDPECGVTVGASGLDPQAVGPISVDAEGSLVFPYQTRWAFGRYGRVLRLTPQNELVPIPEAPRACAPEPLKDYREIFMDIGSAARDPQGHTWVMDYGRCQLKRVAPDETVTTLLDKPQVCPAGDPEHHVRADYMVWDKARGEMVMGGSLLWLKSPKADLYSTIWRVRPDGTFTRVYLAGKLRKGLPHIDGLSGLALDPNGRIIFGAGFVRADGHQLLRLDEAKGRTESIAGAPQPSGTSYADGPANQAHFGTIKGLCAVPDGTLFVHDANHVIRKVTPAGHVTTWAF
ncbi:MAG: hypothetical protein NNA23_02485 [Nitrospira sp.]|nr:hypothetical protein [Nitrospira sp.]